MKEKKDLDKVIKKMREQIRNVRHVTQAKIRPPEKARPVQKK